MQSQNTRTFLFIVWVRVSEYIPILISSNYTLHHAKTRNASTWNWGAGSGKYMNSSRSWWKKRKMTFGVQNPLAGPGGEPRFSIDARSFIPPRELLYLCEWMNAQLPLFPLPFYPLHCYLNPPIPNFHARHVSRKSSRLRAIALSKEF